MICPTICIVGSLGEHRTSDLRACLFVIVIPYRIIVSGIGMTNALSRLPNNTQLFDNATVVIWFGGFGGFTVLSNIYSVFMIAWKAWCVLEPFKELPG